MTLIADQAIKVMFPGQRDSLRVARPGDAVPELEGNGQLAMLIANGFVHFEKGAAAASPRAEETRPDFDASAMAAAAGEAEERKRPASVSKKKKKTSRRS